MTAVEFVAAFADAVGMEAGELTTGTELNSLETWDSVAYLSVMTIVDESMGVAIDPEGMLAARTVGDLYALACSQQAA